MTDKNSISLSIAVDNNTFKAIQQLAIEEDIATGLALDIIVEEWADMNSDKGLTKIADKSPVDTIEAKLRHIDSITGDIAQKLKRLSL